MEDEMRAWGAGIIFALLAAGCGDDAPRAPQVVSTNFQSGAVSPTATLSITWSAPIDAASLDGNVYLARGEPDAELEHPPPPVHARARLTAGDVAIADGTRVDFTPRRALAPEDRYTLYVGPKLVVGGRQLGRPLALAVDTAGLDQAAPLLELVRPDDAAVDVARNLRAVEVAWSRPVSSPLALALVDDDGAVVSTRAALAGGGVSLALDAVLDAGRHYRVRAGPDARDAEGRAPFGDPPGFTAGDGLRTDPVALDGLDVASADRCVVVRFATDVPTWSEVCAGARCAADGPLAAHEAALAFGDALDGQPLAIDARAWDETTRPGGEARASAAAPSRLALALTEVLTRPLGPRPAQQFVELYNAGADAVDLGALTLHTASGSNALPSVSLAPSSFALVVPSGWVAGAGGDPAPLAGTLIARLAEDHLGGRGLRVAGEPVWLEDADGRVVTRWGGYPLALAAGQSVERAAGDCDVAASFRPTPSGGSTPGGP
jgi:hypothetical protein